MKWFTKTKVQTILNRSCQENKPQTFFPAFYFIEPLCINRHRARESTGMGRPTFHYFRPQLRETSKVDIREKMGTLNNNNKDFELLKRCVSQTQISTQSSRDLWSQRIVLLSHCMFSFCVSDKQNKTKKQWLCKFVFCERNKVGIEKW